MRAPLPTSAWRSAALFSCKRPLFVQVAIALDVCDRTADDAACCTIFQREYSSQLTVVQFICHVVLVPFPEITVNLRRMRDRSYDT